jgi:nitroreductase
LYIQLVELIKFRWGGTIQKAWSAYRRTLNDALTLPSQTGLRLPVGERENRKKEIAVPERSLFKTDPVLKAIKERRSIRRFENKDVELSKIQLILEAGTWAPSANNEQPWKFVVVKNQGTKEVLLRVFLDRMQNYFERQGMPSDKIQDFWSGIFSAPVCIFVFCDTSVMEIEKGFEEIEMLWGTQGVSAACQNMLLAAHVLGLGTVWTGAALIVEDGVKSAVGVPDEARLVTMIAVGYPASRPAPRSRRSLSDVAFFERWGTGESTPLQTEGS